jgi:hypothetical protein
MKDRGRFCEASASERSPHRINLRTKFDGGCFSMLRTESKNLEKSDGRNPFL